MLKYYVKKRKSPIDQSIKHYGQLAPINPVKLSQLAELISEACTVTVHDVKAVLSALETALIREFRLGNSVRFGDLGSFRPSLSTKGANTVEDFTNANIKRVRVRFTPSAKMGFELSTSNPAVTFQNLGIHPDDEEDTTA